MRFFRFAFSLFVFAIVVWFSVSVPLGNRTLFGHLRAIWATPEAQDLAAGTREEARKAAERLQKELTPTKVPAKPLSPSTSLPEPEDPAALDRLVRETVRPAKPHRTHRTSRETP